MNIVNYFDKKPQIAKDAFIAPNAYIIGDVIIGSKSSVWFNSAIRGDVEKITIGNETNIQDGTIIHVSRNQGPTIIGSKVTIGHKCLLHACVIDDLSFVGMNAVIMDYARIETHAMVAAGSLVTPGKIIPTGELWAGSPAKFFRKLTQEEINFIEISASNYTKHNDEYLNLFQNK